jgi:hypothetical protein
MIAYVCVHHKMVAGHCSLEYKERHCMFINSLKVKLV